MKTESRYQQPRTVQIKPRTTAAGQNRVQNQFNGGTTPSFTGGFDTFLRFLDTNQAWGANAVDFFCMVLPRTLTDFTRGPEAGMETARREGMGTVNHSMVGAYGTLAGLAFATGINGLYQLGENDYKAGSIFADAETMDMQGKIYDSKLKASLKNPNINPLKEFVIDTLKNYEALSPDDNGKWVRFKDDDVRKAAEVFEKEFAAPARDMSKEGIASIRNTLMSSAGVENTFRIVAGEGEKQHSSRYTLDSIIENIYKLGKTFSKDTVKDAFLKAEDITKNEFINSMKKMNVKRSLLGIGMASAVGMSVQPLNMYLTKKKTGSDSFVGGGTKDDSLGFKIRKSLVALLFGSGVIATIGNPKNLIKNLQFKGLTPTINQFKFIYGVTIMSRFFSARNDNELRESAIKDTLGFANWLILGNVVQKLVAKTLDKSGSLIKKDGEGWVNWLKGSVLKSRDEVVHAALGNNVFDKDGKPLSYKQMVEALPKNSPARKQLRILSIAQLAGYAYSGLVLGRGIPKLNIYITNKTEKKKQAEEAARGKAQQVDNMFKRENIEFLSSRDVIGKELLAK